MLNWWNSLAFANPEFFYLLGIIPVLVGWYVWKYNQHYPQVQLPTLEGLGNAGKDWVTKTILVPFVLRMLVIVSLVVALARPQTSLDEEKVTTEGIDIVLAIDISSSMLAEDFKPNRLEASKKVATDFIDDRLNDRVGLVIFSGESFTQCPITTDHSVVKNLMKDVKTGLVEDGTAIGMGLATAVNRLKESEVKSKVIILLTDGDNNAGIIDPATAAEAAIQFGIRVYTIGVGSRGMAPYPFKTRLGIQYQDVEVKINEELLQQIADMTGGNYYRATGNRSLEDIYEKIDQLEKSKIEVTAYQRKSEQYHAFAAIGGILFLLELLLRYTLYRFNP